MQIKNFRSAIKEGGDETGEKPNEEEAKPVHSEVKSENTGKD
ncbi:MAG: hypothetical protein WAW61_15350 [Methylococcaceae bacterium]